MCGRLDKCSRLDWFGWGEFHQGLSGTANWVVAQWLRPMQIALLKDVFSGFFFYGWEDVTRSREEIASGSVKR